MIILRQREYSSRLTKLIYGAKQIGNKMTTASGNVGSSLRKLIHASGSKEALTITANQKLGPVASKVQTARESILARKAISHAVSKEGIKEAGQKIKTKALDKAISAARTAEDSLKFPGKTVNKGIGALIQSPIAVTGEIANDAVPFLLSGGSPVRFAKLQALPIRVGGVGVEAFVRKKVPAYARLTDSLGAKYRASKLSRRLGNITGLDALRMAQTLPLA